MQPAVFVAVPWRGAFAAALALITAVLVVPPERALSSTGSMFAARVVEAHRSAIASIVAADMIAARATRDASGAIDASWHRANHLAWVVEHRRYGEIEAAAAMVGRASPYAAWVPAAVGLAVEQLDATAGAYARLGMCGELAGFLARTAHAWPAGRATMRPIACGAVASTTARATLIHALGGLDAYRRAERVMRAQRPGIAEIEDAIASGDHARALARCGAMGTDVPMPASCLAAACRASELAIAEVLLPHGDAGAVRACAQADVTFVDGIAHAPGRPNPADLVRVHPDAPPLLEHWLHHW